MDVKKLQSLAERHPEVQELLKDNYSLSVSLMAARMDAWQQKMEKRLETFDGNHTRAQSALADRMKQLEDRLQSAALYSRDLRDRIKKLEATNGENTTGQGQPEEKKAVTP